MERKLMGISVHSNVPSINASFFSAPDTAQFDS